MVSTDPISDMFTRIRNAILVNQDRVLLPYSKVKDDIAQILAANDYLEKVSVDEVDGRKALNIEIAGHGRPPRITELKRLSRPGRRVYVQAKEIPKVKRGRGMVILSTSKGILAGSDASAKRLGGELICEVY